MLKIQIGSREIVIWQIGDGVPTIPANTRVIQLQADGDELEMILQKMKEESEDY